MPSRDNWSGRRGSNPRPTAWKAVTLPLSYSRLCARRVIRLALRQARPPFPFPSPSLSRRLLAKKSVDITSSPADASSALVLRALQRAQVGGEGRTRTFEAARATDLQSAAFDRFATSPACCYVGKRLFRLPATGSSVDGAGEGIRTPDLLITNQLLYRPELRQPKQKWNYSTSCATRAI